MWSYEDVMNCAGCNALSDTRNVRCAQLVDGPLGRTWSGAGERRCTVTVGGVTAGQRLATLFGHGAVGMWPHTGRRWWPQPREAAEGACNARWDGERCECGQWRVHLVALQAIAPRCEVTVCDGPFFCAWKGREWAWEVAFDGGARCAHGRRVAGAGAVVWGALGGDGTRKVIAQAVMSIPAAHHAQYAEAFACGEALKWLAGIHAEDRTVRIFGDSLNVVRYCADVGGMRRPEMQSLLEGPLSALHAKGWRVDWLAVRRHFNTHADALATAGVIQAERRACDGLMTPGVTWTVF
ncbi:MAG: reverse transcriptase-like protein [Candidatus Fonsibacter sp.]